MIVSPPTTLHSPLATASRGGRPNGTRRARQIVPTMAPTSVCIVVCWMSESVARATPKSRILGWGEEEVAKWRSGQVAK